jgi:hypothetical protein
MKCEMSVANATCNCFTATKAQHFTNNHTSQSIGMTTKKYNRKYRPMRDWGRCAYCSELFLFPTRHDADRFHRTQPVDFPRTSTCTSDPAAHRFLLSASKITCFMLTRLLLSQDTGNHTVVLKIPFLQLLPKLGNSAKIKIRYSTVVGLPNYGFYVISFLCCSYKIHLLNWTFLPLGNCYVT